MKDYLKRIEVHHTTRSFRQSRPYKYVCPNCLIEHGLQDESEYKISDLKAFVEENQRNAIVPTLLETTDGKEYLQFANGDQYLMTRGFLKFVADEIYKTLELGEDFDEFVKENNKLAWLGNFYSRSKYDKEKLAIPIDKLRIRKKKFNTKKRKWSFKCGNCSERISSEDGGTYYSIMPEYEFDADLERACSSGCAYVIAKDIINEWLDEKEDERKFFYTENIDEQLKEYIRG